MNSLFDRYFLVLVGRLSRDHWRTVTAPVHVGSGVITLDWPREEEESTSEGAESVPFAKRSSS